MRVLCIIPSLNEASRVRSLVRAMPPEVTETLVVDDGSADGTGEVAADAGARVLRNDATRGLGASLLRGYALAAREGFDVAVALGGNGLDDPREVPRLLEPIAQDVADFVQGSRVLSRRSWPAAKASYRRAATRLHPLLLRLATGANLTDSTNGFHAIHRRVLTDGRLVLRAASLKGYQLGPWLLARALLLGYRVVEVPVNAVSSRIVNGLELRGFPLARWLERLEPVARAAVMRAWHGPVPPRPE